MTTIEVGGATLQVHDSGDDGTAAGLILLHYWGGSARTWRKVMARLVGVARCVALDQRGWGRSMATDGRFDLDAMADDVAAVIEALGLTHVVLVGHSMGGKVAQIVAMRGRPEVRGLVLVAPAPPTPMPVSQDVRGRMLESYRSSPGVEQALEMLAGPSLPRDDRPTVVADTLMGASEAKREWTERGMVADLGMTPHQLSLPITVLVGTLDRVEAPYRLSEIFGVLAPQTRFMTLEGVGHLAPLEAPEQVAEACRAMFEQTLRTSPEGGLSFSTSSRASLVDPNRADRTRG